MQPWFGPRNSLATARELAIGCEGRLNPATVELRGEGTFAHAGFASTACDRLALCLEIRDLMRSREQASLRRPKLAALVAIALVEDLGVGDRENAGNVLARQLVHVRMEIGRQ